MTLDPPAQEAQERLSKEAQRIARLMHNALGSACLSGKGFADDVPDYCGLWQAIGRELFECVNQRGDDEVSVHYLIAGWIEAQKRHMDDGERRAATKKLLKLLGLDGIDPS